MDLVAALAPSGRGLLRGAHFWELEVVESFVCELVGLVASPTACCGVCVETEGWPAPVVWLVFVDSSQAVSVSPSMPMSTAVAVNRRKVVAKERELLFMCPPDTLE